jgi:hypothetical protein
MELFRYFGTPVGNALEISSMLLICVEVYSLVEAWLNVEITEKKCQSLKARA